MLSPQPGGHPGHRLPPAQRCVGQGHGIGLGGFQECTRRGPDVRMIDLGCRHDLGQRLIGVGQSTQRSCGAAPAVRRCGGNGVGHPGYRVRILLDLRRVDVGAGNAAREQAVAPGQRRYRLRGQGISQGFAFGANPVPCAHIRCRVPSPRPYRPDHDLVAVATNRTSSRPSAPPPADRRNGAGPDAGGVVKTCNKISGVTLIGTPGAGPGAGF